MGEHAENAREREAEAAMDEFEAAIDDAIVDARKKGLVGAYIAAALEHAAQAAKRR